METVVDFIIIFVCAVAGIGFMALLFWHQDNYTSKPDTFRESIQPWIDERKRKSESDLS